jgi:hypothetical protein
MIYAEGLFCRMIFDKCREKEEEEDGRSLVQTYPKGRD